MNPDTFRIRVDGQLRFEYATCGWNVFEFIWKEKVSDSKISGYVWSGRGRNFLRKQNTFLSRIRSSLLKTAPFPSFSLLNSLKLNSLFVIAGKVC